MASSLASSFNRSRDSFSFLHQCLRLLDPILDSRPFRFIRRHTSFYRLHLCYILSLITAGTLILWLSPKPEQPISFVDALFTATSASTVTGLFCLSMSQLSIFDKLVLMCLMALGSQWFTSLLPVLVRRFYFYKFLKQAQRLLTAVGPMVELTTAGRNSNKKNVSDPMMTENFFAQTDSSKNGFIKAWLESSQDDDQGNSLQAKENKNPAALSTETDSKHSFRSSVSKNSKYTDDTVAISMGTLIADGHDGSDTQSAIAGNGDKQQSGSLVTPLEEQSPNSKLTPLPSQGNPEKASTEYLNTPLTKLEQTVEEEEEDAENSNRKIVRSRFPSLGRNDSVVAGGEELDDMSLSTEYLASIPAIESEALRLLSFLVPIYGIFFVSVSFLLTRVCLFWSDAQTEALERNRVNPTFFSAFISLSSFANAGISLMDDSLFSFRENIFFTFVLSINILVGNTMLAPTMRIIIFLLYKFFPLHHKTVLKYLLENPRKCYTHLFPYTVSLWLVFTVFAFNFLELMCFYALDWDDLGNIPTRYKLWIGYFQSINTRNAGFTVVSISSLSPAMLVLYLSLMYVSMYPVYLSRQRTRIDVDSFEATQNRPKIPDQEKIFAFDREIFSQGRLMLARDSAFLFLSIFIICILHNARLKEIQDPNFSIFNVIFEVISAYANNGLSLGYTCPEGTQDTCISPPYSFSGTWKDDAKIALVIVMIAGRHRGLPDDVDTAVSIPKRDYVENQSIFASRHDFDLHAITSIQKENTIEHTPVLSDYFPYMDQSSKSHSLKTDR